MTRNTNTILVVIAVLIAIGILLGLVAWHDSTNAYRDAGMWTPH